MNTPAFTVPPIAQIPVGVPGFPKPDTGQKRTADHFNAKAVSAGRYYPRGKVYDPNGTLQNTGGILGNGVIPDIVKIA